METKSTSVQVDPASLLEAHRGDLWGYMLNHVRNRADAEDLFQEVHLKVLNKVTTLEEPARFRSWMFSIAMNTVRSFFRKKQMVSLDCETHPEPVYAEDTPLENLEKKQHLQQLRACIHRLPERDREVLLLDFMAELPQMEIAQQLDLNINTVKTITRRAKIKLARMMAEVSHG